MAREINLNSDMGEGFGAYDIGNDTALLDIVNSANVACGFHAGDPKVMHRLVTGAKRRGVSIGAHPGFDDVQGFGRRQIHMKADEVEYMVAYQIGALQAMAQYAGMKVTHVKAHGALSNMACRDRDYAAAIGRAIKTVDNSLVFVVVHGSELQRVCGELGLTMAREGFADRQYDDDGQLASRAIAGAVLHDPRAAAKQALMMAKDREVISRTGKRLKIEVETICVHGDEPTAVPVAKAVRAALEGAKFKLKPLDRMQLGRANA
jgi:UPF0271 protein